MTTTAFVGDVGEYLAELAKTFCSDACLIDHTNWQQALAHDDAVVYTSLGDFSDNGREFWCMLQHCDQIFYAPPITWSDGKQSHDTAIWCSMQGQTEYHLACLANFKHNVTGLDSAKWYPCDVLGLADQRRHDLPQLWVAGCSVTVGIGVEPQQRYGQLLSDWLQQPVSHLAASGSSIQWQTDQILRSDVRRGDTVIWGLTSLERFPLWTQHNTVKHINVNHRNKAGSVCLPDSIIDQLLTDPTLRYQAITHVYQAANFCRKIGATLLVLGLHLTTSELAQDLAALPEFVFYPRYPGDAMIDLGTDGEHPGALQHHAYARFALDCLGHHTDRNA